MFRSLALIVLLATVGNREPGPATREEQSGSPLPAPVSRPALEDDDAIVHALNRLTYGPRAGDVDRVRAMGLHKWIALQLSPARIDDSALERRLQRLETLTLDSQAIVRDYAAPAMMERRRRAAERADDTAKAPQSTESPDRDAGRMMREPASEAQRNNRRVIADIEEAKLLRAVY